jgi:hypothetical protein
LPQSYHTFLFWILAASALPQSYHTFLFWIFTFGCLCIATILLFPL